MTSKHMIHTPWGPMEIDENASDGYGTIRELYHHADALFARLCVVKAGSTWATTIDNGDGSINFMVGIDVSPMQAVVWYLPLHIYERLHLEEVDEIPSTYPSNIPQTVEWLLGQPMPAIKGVGVSTAFTELHALRYALFIVLCHECSDRAWKSLLHKDGTMFDDYFIAGIDLPCGSVSYHLPIELWGLVKVTELPSAPS